MIGRLQGVLLEKQEPDLLIDVQGVGYEVQVSLTTFLALPVVGEPVTLHTHFVVREDAQLLYGFVELRERTLFRTLIKVNGVGPKMGLAILSGMSPDDFVRSVRRDDVKSLTGLPGVGKKTAERLVIEMRDRLKDWDIEGGEAASDESSSGQSTSTSVVDEATSALIALGYKAQNAEKMVLDVANSRVEPFLCEELIRRALQGTLA